jgi:hypothetical protein
MARGRGTSYCPLHFFAKAVSNQLSDPNSERQDKFTSKTPEGAVEFTNLIATFDIEAERKVVLAAHHDSKWFKDGPEAEVSAVNGGGGLWK